MSKCENCGSRLITKVVEKYEDKLLGIPRVFLYNTVSQEVCPKCQTVQSVNIPNLQGLITAVAVYRVGRPFKLNGREIRFLRKALEITAKELADKLFVRPETVSRWETNSEPIGPQSEKIFRLIVGERLADKAPLIKFVRKDILEMDIKAWRVRPLTMNFHVVKNNDQSWEEAQRQDAA